MRLDDFNVSKQPLWCTYLTVLQCKIPERVLLVKPANNSQSSVKRPTNFGFWRAKAWPGLSLSLPFFLFLTYQTGVLTRKTWSLSSHMTTLQPKVICRLACASDCPCCIAICKMFQMFYAVEDVWPLLSVFLLVLLLMWLLNAPSLLVLWN